MLPAVELWDVHAGLRVEYTGNIHGCARVCVCVVCVKRSFLAKENLK